MCGGKSQTSKVRDERIDSVKYWLIVLVIAGHVFRRPEFEDSMACMIAQKWIYIFHMPLFIFISGYFSPKKEWKDLWPSIWKLLEPFIIFQTLTRLPRFILNNTDNPFITALTPWFALWYLLSLIYWRFIIQIIPDRILSKTKLILISSFCISILAGFLPFGIFLSIQRTLAFLPFFFLGYYMRGKNIYLPNKYKPLSFLFLILMVVVPLLFPQFFNNLTHAEPYDNVFGAVKRILVFSLAVLMSIAFINVCPNFTWTAKQGRLTMQYYIYHALAITPIMVIAGKLCIPMSFVSAIFIAIAMTIGIGIVLKLPYFNKFTNPSSLIFK